MTDYSDIAQFVTPEDVERIIAEAPAFPLRRGMTKDDFVSVCIERAGASLDTLLTNRFAIGLRLDFSAATDEFLGLAGPRSADKGQAEDWAELFDGHLEAVLAPTLKLLSQDWIGAYITSTDFDDKTIRDKAADAAAPQIINHLDVIGTTNAKRLSAIGIARSTFDDAYKPDAVASAAADAAATSIEQAAAAGALEPLTSDQVDYYIADLVEKMVSGHEADVSNDATLTVIVNDMLDRDDGLALSRVQVMGGSPDHLTALRNAIKAYQIATVRENLIDAVTTRLIMGPPAPVAPVNVATPSPIGAPGKRSKTAKAAAPAVSDAGATGAGRALESLKLLRMHASDSDDKLGQALGVSRGTVKNWADGKSEFKPSASQLGTLRQLIGERLNGLTAAHGFLA